MEASALSEDSHFKTRYLSMMLSWLMNSQDHTAFADYGCHCKLADVAERKPFVGYTKSASGSKDEIDWFCAQHTTCHQCLATQMSDWNVFFTCKSYFIFFWNLFLKTRQTVIQRQRLIDLNLV